MGPKLLKRCREIAQIAHPGLHEILDCGTDRDLPYVVFEHLNAQPLPEYLSQHGEVDFDATLSLLAETLGSLSGLHQRGIVHGALTPNAILIGPNTSKLGDFDTATDIFAPAPRSTLPRPLALRWDPPEQLKGQTPTTQSDVYSLGQIFLALLDGGDLRARARSTKTHPPHRSTTESTLRVVLQRAVNEAPEARYPDALQMLDALEDWISSCAEDNQHYGTTEFLLRRMRKVEAFQSVSQSMSRLNQFSSTHSHASSNQIANVILRERALAQDLIAVANSAYFGRFSDINSVTEAVRLIGLTQVRHLANALSFLAQYRAMESGLHEATRVAGIASAIATEQLAAPANIDPQEAFSAGLFRNLGALLASIYFPQEHQQILQMSSEQTANEACEAVLGASYTAMGLRVAQLWKFPKILLETINANEVVPASPGKTPSERLRNIALLGNRLVLLRRTPQMETIEDLAFAFKPSLGTTPESLLALVESLTRRLGAVADVFGIQVRTDPVVAELKLLAQIQK